jgi:hypothetical protein
VAHCQYQIANARPSPPAPNPTICELDNTCREQGAAAALPHVVEVLFLADSVVVFLRKKSALRLFVDQCYVAEALMWWNGKHAMARFWSGILVVIRETLKRPRSLGTTDARMAMAGTEDAGRLIHTG